MDELRARIMAMTKAGVFGLPGAWPYVRDNNGEHRLGLNFASEIEFYRIGLYRSATILPEQCDYDYRLIYIAVKTQLKGEKEREFTSNDAMFFNEVYMYKTLLPLIEAEELALFPKCFYAEACSCNNPLRDIVITEDMSHHGYHDTPGLNLDLHHLKTTLRNLGKFHGLSYKAKKSSPSFASKVKELKPIKFDEEFDSLLLATVQRGGLPILNKVNMIEKQLLERFLQVMKQGRAVLRNLKLPEEPFAVICHGEFHKSNILFSNDESGSVKSTIFLDLQMSLYSDPSTDLSFLLFMNASPETRQNHWNELIADYWDGVISVEPDPGFDFDGFSRNFEAKSIYGYLPTSIFLPLMLDDLDANESIEDFLSHPISERIAMMEDLGGIEATEALSQILVELLARGHIAKFLERFDIEH